MEDPAAGVASGAPALLTQWETAEQAARERRQQTQQQQRMAQEQAQVQRLTREERAPRGYEAANAVAAIGEPAEGAGGKPSSGGGLSQLLAGGAAAAAVAAIAGRASGNGAPSGSAGALTLAVPGAPRVFDEGCAADDLAVGSPGKKRRLSVERLSSDASPNTPLVPPNPYLEPYRSCSPASVSDSDAQTPSLSGSSLSSSPGAGWGERALLPYGMAHPHPGSEAQVAALSDALTAAFNGMSASGVLPHMPSLGAEAGVGSIVTQEQVAAIAARAQTQSALQAWLAAMQPHAARMLNAGVSPPAAAASGAGAGTQADVPSPPAGWARPSSALSVTEMMPQVASVRPADESKPSTSGASDAHRPAIARDVAMARRGAGDAKPGSAHIARAQGGRTAAQGRVGEEQEAHDAADAAGVLLTLARDASCGLQPVIAAQARRLARRNSAPAGSLARASSGVSTEAQQAPAARQRNAGASATGRSRASGSRSRSKTSASPKGDLGANASTSRGAGRRRGSTGTTRPTECPWCGATDTPMWRRHPTMKELLLCNACGVRSRRLEKQRAAAAAGAEK